MNAWLESKRSNNTPLGDLCSIGRHPANDITLDDPEASRWHAVVMRMSRGWSLMDLGGKNGTWLNGVKISETLRLKDGDVITIGGVSLRFRINGDEEAQRRQSATALLASTVAHGGTGSGSILDAFETAQFGIIAINRKGRVELINEEARQLLLTGFGHDFAADESLPPELIAWLAASGDDENGESGSLVKSLSGGRQLVCRIKKDLARGHTLLTLLEKRPLFNLEQLRRDFKADFGITPREGEVLYWMTLGKTNEEIGIIIGCEKKTVEKHAEKIREKLGVENRNAAMIAVIEFYLGR